MKYRDGVRPNLLAIGYATLGHGAAIALVCASSWPGRVVGVLLAAHSLVVGTYLVHDCIHESIFRDRRWNARLGGALAWLSDGALAGYERIRRKHLHHHLDRVDPLAFDYRAALAAHPWARAVVIGLEWSYVPAIELLLRAVPVWRALGGREWAAERGRIVAVCASRVACGAVLFGISPLGVALYGLAYLLFLVAARCADAFHHTFDQVLVRDYDLAYGPPPGKDRAYEDANTYTNPLSQRWPVLNLLVLNFTYHNTHHVKPGVPWHRLPAADARLFGADGRRVVPMRRLLADFHAFRVARIKGERAMVMAADGVTQRFVGAVAVSLLTL